ncbi:DUF6578 domain-containing protein [Leucobacter chromiireducens]|nr:DUF6578 domain-containing protein [Leucobacter chromiireducens]
MRILVEISEGEHACCGMGFELGQSATWTLRAVDPQPGPNSAREPGTTPLPLPETELPWFREEHHGETPESVPHWPVTGTVRAIAGVVYPFVPVPGQPRAFTRDTSRPVRTPMARVAAGPSASDVAVFHVELEVPDASELPAYAEDEEAASARQARADAARVHRQLMSDPVGRVLEIAADLAEAQFGRTCTIHRAPDRSAVTIDPAQDRATAIWWIRVPPDAGDAGKNPEDAGRIGIHVGFGSWWFPATPEHAALPAEFLDAAAHGRVAEHVRDRGVDGRRLETRVTGRDGRVWVDHEDLPGPASGIHVAFLAGRTTDRLQHGTAPYEPWRLEPSTD